MGRFHSDPSIWLLGKVGILFRSNAEFPFIRWTDNFLYKLPMGYYDSFGQPQAPAETSAVAKEAFKIN